MARFQKCQQHTKVAIIKQREIAENNDKIGSKLTISNKNLQSRSQQIKHESLNLIILLTIKISHS